LACSSPAAPCRARSSASFRSLSTAATSAAGSSGATRTPPPDRSTSAAVRPARRHRRDHRHTRAEVRRQLARQAHVHRAGPLVDQQHVRRGQHVREVGGVGGRQERQTLDPRTERLQHARWLPSPMSTERTGGCASRAAATTFSSPCLSPMLPLCSATTSSGRQPRRARTAARSAVEVATCVQFGTTCTRSAGTPASWTYGVKAALTTATRVALRSTRRSSRVVASTNRPPPAIPLCAAAGPIRSYTQTTNGARVRRAISEAAAAANRLGTTASTTSGFHGSRCAITCAPKVTSYVARLRALCDGGTVRAQPAPMRTRLHATAPYTAIGKIPPITAHAQRLCNPTSDRR
jgi:hypothetical protein